MCHRFVRVCRVGKRRHSELVEEASASAPSSANLVAALRESCPRLVTFNVRHYQPGHHKVDVLRPGELLLRVRDRLARLADEGKA